MRTTALVLFLLVTAGAARAQCPGDLDGNGQVSADEVIRAVDSALGGCPESTACPGDADGDGRVTIDELMRAVEEAVNGCPPALYVRTSGNDSNDGKSPASALRTIGAAVARIAAGSTVVVGPGTYAEAIVDPAGGTAAQPLVFLGDPTGGSTGDAPGPVVLSARGTNAAGFRLTRARSVVIEGFRITGGSTAGIHIRQTSQAITIQHCEIIGNSGDGVLVQDSDGVLLFDDLLWDNSQRGVALTGSQGARLLNTTIVRNGAQGLFVGARSGRASSGTFVRNAIVQDNQGNNIEVSTDAPSAESDLDAGADLVFPASYSPQSLRAADDIDADALFIDAEGGDFRLSQQAAGEAEDSPALDAAVAANPPGGPDVDVSILAHRSTASDHVADAEPFDLGYHYPIGADPNERTATYFVRTSGRDDNDGLAPTRALRHIARGVALAKAGDTIVVGPGKYSESGLEPAAGTPRRPLLLRADRFGTATLELPGPVIIDAAGTETALRLSRARYVALDGFTITNAGQAVLIRNGSDGVVVRNCEIFGNDDAIAITDSNDVLVFDNLLARNDRRGVVVGGVLGSSGTRLVNNTVADNDQQGILIGSGVGASPASVVQNNIVQSNGVANVEVANVSLDGTTLAFNLVFPANYSPADARLLPRPTDIGADAAFLDSSAADYRLSQTSAGEATTSPAVDAADPATDADLAAILGARSTASSAAIDTAPPDLGYHYPALPGS